MQSTSSSDFTILCVDDEENILSSLKRMLGLNGYKVFTANSGAHGLEILPNNSIDISSVPTFFRGEGAEIALNLYQKFPAPP